MRAWQRDTKTTVWPVFGLIVVATVGFVVSAVFRPNMTSIVLAVIWCGVATAWGVRLMAFYRRRSHDGLVALYVTRPGEVGEAR